MKNILIKSVQTVFLVALLTSTHAQIVIARKQISAKGEATADEIVAKTTIKNNGTATSVTWKRVKNEKPEEWFTAGCDKTKCYFPEVNTGTFEMAPGEEAIMDVYFYPNQKEGEANVFLEISNEGLIIDTIKAYAITNSFVLGILADISVKENDFSLLVENEHFTIKSKMKIDFVLIDQTGKHFINESLPAGSWEFSTQRFPSGIYIAIANSKKFRMVFY